MGATVNNAIKALPSFLRPIDCGGKQDDYSAHGLAVAKTRELPDFDPDFTELPEGALAARSAAMLYHGKEKPPASSRAGDIWLKTD